MPLDLNLIIGVKEISSIGIINLYFYILFVRYKNIADRNFWIMLIGAVFLAFFIDYYIIDKSILLNIIRNIQGIKLENIYSQKRYWDILIGISSLIVTLYIYIIGIKETLKKNLINIIIKPEKMIIIISTLFFLRFMNVSFYCFLLLLGYLLYLLPQNLICLINIEKDMMKYTEKNKIFEEKINENNCYEIYRDLKSEILTNLITENFVLFSENYYFLKKIINSNYFIKLEEKIKKNYSWENTFPNFLSKFYSQIKYLKNISFFDKIDQLYFDSANIFYENRDVTIEREMMLNSFKFNISNFQYLYKYYLKIDDKIEKKEFQGKLLWVLRYSFSEFYKLELIEKLEWFSAYLAGITKTIRLVILNEDTVTFSEILRVVKKSLEMNFFNVKELSYFGYSFYFGLELLIGTLEDRISKEKYKEFLVECRNYELKFAFFSLKDFLIFYNFLINKKIKEKLEWQKFYEPVEEFEFYGEASWIDDSSLKINQLIIMKLSKYRGIIREEYKKEQWELFAKNIVFQGRMPELLNLVEEENKEKIIKLFKIIEEDKHIEERNKKIKNNISNKRIEEIKKTISDKLRKSPIINYLKENDAYKEENSLEIREMNYGMRFFLDRDLFFEEKNFKNCQGIFKDFADHIEKGIQYALMKKIEGIKNTEFININEINTIENIKEFLLISKVEKVFELQEKLDTKFHNCLTPKTKLNELVFGNYTVENAKLPIILLNYESNDNYLFNFKKIKFVHRTNISSEEKVEFCKMSVLEYEDFFNIWAQDKILELEFLKRFDKKDERVEELKSQVYFMLVQDFDIIVDEDAKLYKIIFD